MSEEASVPSNRAATIKTAVNEILRLNSEIETLQKERTAVKNKLVKGELGMKITDFNIFLRVHQLENDDRNRLFDTLREGFKALGIGEQSSFLSALDETAMAVPAGSA